MVRGPLERRILFEQTGEVMRIVGKCGYIDSKVAQQAHDFSDFSGVSRWTDAIDGFHFLWVRTNGTFGYDVSQVQKHLVEEVGLGDVQAKTKMAEASENYS